jgi:hypothetical protein
MSINLLRYFQRLPQASGGRKGPTQESPSLKLVQVSALIMPRAAHKMECVASDEDARAADLLQEYEAMIAAREKLDYIRHHRPAGISTAEGCL